MTNFDPMVTLFTHPNTIALFTRAKEIVMLPKTEFGYSDIGDQIVCFLRGEKSTGEVIESMNNLAIDYERSRSKSKCVSDGCEICDNERMIPISEIQHCKRVGCPYKRDPD